MLNATKKMIGEEDAHDDDDESIYLEIKTIKMTSMKNGSKVKTLNTEH